MISPAPIPSSWRLCQPPWRPRAGGVALSPTVVTRTAAAAVKPVICAFQSLQSADRGVRRRPMI